MPRVEMNKSLDLMARKEATRTIVWEKTIPVVLKILANIFNRVKIHLIAKELQTRLPKNQAHKIIPIKIMILKS